MIQLPSNHAARVASGVRVAVRTSIALLLASAAASAGQPVFTSFTSRDGLAHDRVLRIVRDSRGFLWFCTGEGLSRFDGQRFRTFGVAEGLPAALISDLLESRDGSYWVATDGGGIARFRPEAPAGERPFTVIGLGSEPAGPPVCRLAQGSGGELWAGTLGGLFRLDAGSGRFLPFPLGLPGVPDRAVRVWALAPSADGTMWVGHDHGLSRVFTHGEAAEHFTIQPTPAGDNVWDLRLDRSGRLWVAHERTITVLLPSSAGPGGPPRPPWTRLLEGPPAAQADGSLRLPGEKGEAVRYGPAHGLITVAAGALLEAADGTLWIGNKGVSAFDGRRIRSYTAKDGLPDSAVICLAEDRDGAIWMGTRARGAVKLSRYDIENRSLSDAPGDEGVTSFFEDGDAVYAVSPAGRLRRIDAQGGVTTLELPVARALRAPVPFARPGVLRGRDGGWWIATAAGLVRMAPMPADRIARAQPLAVYTTSHGLGSDAIGLLHEDRDGNLWIGHSREAVRPLSRWSAAHAAFLAYGADEGLLAHDTVTAMVEDGEGRLFVALAGGVVARRDGERFTALAGLDPAVTGGVLDLLFDREGRLWIATARSGLRRVSDPAGPAPRIEAFTARDGLASDSVRGLVDDRFGRVYALTSRGIDCLDPRELRCLRRFTTAQGVRNYFFQAAFRDSRGALWLGSREGLTRLVPERWEPLPPPLALVEGLQVSGVRWPVAEVGQREVGPLRLNHRQDNLQIDFLALDFGGDATRFRHRLDGVDGEWSPPSLERSVHYGRLAPGDYRFRVKADAVDATEALVRFRIEPPLWARAWFRAAAALAGIALAVAAYRARVSRLLALERVRTRIAADLHDDLGATVSRMAVLSEVARRQVASAPGEATRLLEEIGRSARALLDTTSDIVWAIDPRRDDAASLAARVREFGAGLLEPKGIAWEFQASPEAEALRLDPEQRRQLLLIFKEALHNVARHARCAAAYVSIATRDGRLCAEIRDDGIGFDEDPAGAGHGLRSMHTRAAGLGGELRIDSRPGTGTRLTLDVPLRRPGA